MYNILDEKNSEITKKILSKAEISTMYIVLASPSVQMNFNTFCCCLSGEFFFIVTLWRIS